MQIAEVKVFVALTGKDWGTGKDLSIPPNQVFRDLCVTRKGISLCYNFFLYFTN